MSNYQNNHSNKPASNTNGPVNSTSQAPTQPMIDEDTSTSSNRDEGSPIKNKGKLAQRSTHFFNLFDAGLPKNEIMLTLNISQTQYRTLLEEAYDRKNAPSRPTPSYQVESAHQLPGGIKFQFQECYDLDISDINVKSEIWTLEKVIAQKDKLPGKFQILLPLNLKHLSGNDQ